MESNIGAALIEVVFLAGELEALRLLFPDHPCRHHFRHGRPRLHEFTIQPSKKEYVMSSTTSPAVTYLNAASTPFTVTALDQYGVPFTGDLSGVTVTSDTPANVTATLGAFTAGVATLTLDQAGGEGSANVTVADGAVSYTMPVMSYTPVLTSFTVAPVAAAPAAPVAPAPAAPATGS